MDNINFPALFQSADEASNKAQRRYLLLIRAEYLVLFIAAALSMPWSTDPIYYAAYAFIFVISIVLLLVRKLMKLEQSWYRTRALAESIKTSSWRYMMKTPPFDGQQADARREFVGLLRELLGSNREAGRALASTVTTGDQVTDLMEEHRSQDLADRKAIYISDRIDDQSGWYARKAIFNRNASITWITACIVVYIMTGGIVLSRIAFPEWTLWPISPLVVFASSIIGWMQIKKFGELSSAYALTAQEIGLIKVRVGGAMEEGEFSEFVNEAELAFSREHTQWIARQHM